MRRGVDGPRRRYGRGSKPILTASQLMQLRKLLGQVHGRFCRHYGVDLEAEGFAMEVEFKITRDGKVAIKQARPWVR